jgi:hypothetical protein
MTDQKQQEQTYEERYGGMDPRENTLTQEEKDELIQETDEENARR